MLATVVVDAPQAKCICGLSSRYNSPKSCKRKSLPDRAPRLSSTGLESRGDIRALLSQKQRGILPHLEHPFLGGQVVELSRLSMELELLAVECSEDGIPAPTKALLFKD